MHHLPEKSLFMCIFNEINIFEAARGKYDALINSLHARKFLGADPGILEREFICINEAVGGSLCRFYLIFLKHPMNMK